MRLRINHHSVQIHQIPVVAEQQKEILERLAQEERLHHVAGANVSRVPDIFYGRVAVCDLRVGLEALEDPPAHVAIGGVACQTVHVPEAFYELGA